MKFGTRNVLGKKVQKVLRIGKKVLAVAGAVGGAYLGVKHVQNQHEHKAYQANQDAEMAKWNTERHTQDAKAIMDKLDADADADKRLRSSVISGAAAKGKIRIPVPPPVPKRSVITGETAMDKLHRQKKEENWAKKTQARRDEKQRVAISTRANIAKAEEGLRVKKKKKTKTKTKYHYGGHLTALGK